MWSIDGVAITDMTATGTSPTYYDFNVSSAVHDRQPDARQQTAAWGSTW
jgi:hypothetical protein